MPRNTRSSFSLIELLIGLSIIMILCSLWPARFFDYNRRILVHELDLLFFTCSYLQQRALASNQDQELIFDLTNNIYSYTFGAQKKFFSKKLAKEVKFGFCKNTKGPPSNPRLPITKAFTFEQHTHKNDLALPRILFLPNGKITPGTIYLVDKQEKNMVSLTCPVSQVSYIRKYRYENNKWVMML